jgi:hypothetical protein
MSFTLNPFPDQAPGGGQDSGPGVVYVQGPPGNNGLSAYQIAVRDGFSGSETQWLASLHGATGNTGNTGPAIELQVSGGHVQYRAVGSNSWNNLIAVSSLVGATGLAGSNGSPGASVNLQVSGGYIQWQHTGDSSWTNLIAISSLQGAPGSNGASVNLQVAGGYIQWQHVGDLSWNNLIAVSSLVGATGATGTAGSNGSPGAAGASVNLQVAGGYIQWQHVGDSSWTNLIAVSSLVGATGATGATGPAGSDASVTSSNVIAGLGYTPLRPSNNLSDIANAATARTNLGLGTASTQASTAFDVAGAASMVQAASLQKSSNLSDVANVVTARTNLGLGTAATQSSTAFDAAGSASTAQAYSIQRSNHTGSQAISTITGLQTALDGKQASGTYATLVSGTVPSSQLPSYVDDVLEYANLAGFPSSGETGKIYVDKATNKIYRWSGSTYIEISPSPGSTDSVTEGSTNLYFTAARAVSALTSTLSSYATSSAVTSAINALSSVYTTTAAVASQISTALSGYATQSWVTAQGFSTSLGVSSAISSAISALGLGTASTHAATDFDAAGAAASAQTAAESYASGLVSNITPLFPLGSSAISSGGQYPTNYTIQDQSGNIIGYINLSYDGNNRITGIACTDASSTSLTHGNWTISYDGSGNLASVVCTN